jgi:hypothetical protein
LLASIEEFPVAENWTWYTVLYAAGNFDGWCGNYSWGGNPQKIYGSSPVQNSVSLSGTPSGSVLPANEWYVYTVTYSTSLGLFTFYADATSVFTWNVSNNAGVPSYVAGGQAGIASAPHAYCAYTAFNGTCDNATTIATNVAALKTKLGSAVI